ncbi:uncharacterized protein LOC123548316 isoform X2 [Mercenaria mercenaria]|uniref:uncharacterized protein LOC123548316 isoform X1 n=1 Tax=Mercenaria mercenaria TaxID=6596 RepID=UPI001E1DABF9|nr:uncharacterized protein LOC123548316 isoform X1 [Mercenaria mercenaria]XP_053402518.1 uncharacterized protein LOC123548316 isoform X2 [Mercenaria mercenaria]
MEMKVFLIVFISLLKFSSQMSVESLNSSSLVNATETLGLTPSHLYMNLLCGYKKLLRSRDAILMSPWSNKYPRSTQTCEVGVQNTKYLDYKFVITFKKMKLYRKTSGICQKSRLDLFNGQSTYSIDKISDVNGLCGTHTDHTAYETRTSFLTLKYTTLNLPSGYAQDFEAVITPFHRGTCKHDEFKCQNGNCIKNNMLCDSYNNCGDDSDEEHCAAILTVAVIVGIVVGCVVFIAVVGIIICCCCCGWCCAACTYESF